MARFKRVDVLFELIELSNEVVGSISQQLGYYRASVYKDEAATQIWRKIEQLQMIAELFQDDMMLDAFEDFEAELSNGGNSGSPGECLFSTRIKRLLTRFEAQIHELKLHLSQSDVGLESEAALERSIQCHRHEILSLCEYGSRQWSFFYTI